MRFADDASYGIGHSASADGVSLNAHPKATQSLKQLALYPDVLLSLELGLWDVIRVCDRDESSWKYKEKARGTRPLKIGSCGGPALEPSSTCGGC